MQSRTDFVIEAMHRVADNAVLVEHMVLIDQESCGLFLSLSGFSLAKTCEARQFPSNFSASSKRTI